MPKAVRKLCHMSERLADRDHPYRLREQAIVACAAEIDREVSAGFLQKVREQEAVPTIFGAKELISVAKSRLELEVINKIESIPNISMVDAIGLALCERGASYAREQKSELVADRHEESRRAPDSVRSAFREAAPIVARSVLDRVRVTSSMSRITLEDNLRLGC